MTLRRAVSVEDRSLTGAGSKCSGFKYKVKWGQGGIGVKMEWGQSGVWSRWNGVKVEWGQGGVVLSWSGVKVEWFYGGVGSR